MTAVRVLLVGYGFASATFHAPLIQAVQGLELAGVVSRDPAKVHAQWPGVPVYPDLAQGMAHCDAPLVVIASPNDTHHPLAAQALAAGRHVVVDKPFTLTVAEADDLIARAQSAQRVLSVFHNRRWDSDFLELQRLQAEGTLGRWTHVESHFDRFRPEVRQRWRESDQPGGGLWYDLGPHLLDQALQLLGPPDSLWLDTALQRDGARADDWFHAVLAYGSLRVVLHASALTARLAPRWLVHGTLGSYETWGLDAQEDALKAGINPQNADWGLDPRPGTLTLAEGDALRTHTLAPTQGDYKRYYADLRDALLDPAQHAVPVPATQAREVMRWIELGLQSQREGRVIRAV